MHEIKGIGRPAQHALNHIGIHSFEQLTNVTEKQLKKIHGVGPKAVSIIKEQLESMNLNLAIKEPFENLPFILIGDLSCDNAPKRRVLMNYVVATAVLDHTMIADVLEADMTWNVPGEITIEDRDSFVEELRAHQQDIASIELQSIVTHGKEGAVNGTMTLTSGNKVYFGDFVTFASSKKDAKIKSITSYVMMKE